MEIYKAALTPLLQINPAELSLFLQVDAKANLIVCVFPVRAVTLQIAVSLPGCAQQQQQCRWV